MSIIRLKITRFKTPFTVNDFYHCISTMVDFDSDPFMLIRSMMLTEFRCPPLPMRGQFAEDGSDTVINSHDLMATLVAQAYRLSDESKNNTRRRKQEELRERYLADMVKHAGSFENVYPVMANHTKHYIATYLLGTPFSASDLHVLAPDRITPKLAIEIDHYGRALKILMDGSVGKTPSRSDAPDESVTVSYESHETVKTLLMQCARCAVKYEEQGLIDEPVFKRMRNGVDAE